MNNPYYTEEHESFRQSLRAFVTKDIEPFASEWDEAGDVPAEAFIKAAEVGLMGLGFPEEYGGIPGDWFYKIIANEELARAGSGGILSALTIHHISMTPVAVLGSPEMKERVIPDVVAGKKRIAIGITEPGGGSDVAGIRTTARKDGNHYILNGSKTFITGGIHADYYVIVARTGEPGAKGLSLLLVDKETPGFAQTRLKKMGWWSSDTATLYFEDCRIPAENLLGEENSGFMEIMRNFNPERLTLAAQTVAFSQVATDEATEYAKIRETFGKPLISNQVIRHKIVDMNMRTKAAKAYLENLAWRVEAGEMPVAELCMLKNLGSTTLEYVAGEAVQILGGAGYMRGGKCERIFRETKVQSIGGGTIEIMKDLASRQMGL